MPVEYVRPPELNGEFWHQIHDGPTIGDEEISLSFEGTGRWIACVFMDNRETGTCVDNAYLVIPHSIWYNHPGADFGTELWPWHAVMMVPGEIKWRTYWIDNSARSRLWGFAPIWDFDAPLDDLGNPLVTAGLWKFPGQASATRFGPEFEGGFCTEQSTTSVMEVFEYRTPEGYVPPPPAPPDDRSAFESPCAPLDNVAWPYDPPNTDAPGGSDGGVIRRGRRY